MKKYIGILSLALSCLVQASHEMPPPFTEEMHNMQLQPIPSKINQIVNIYLLDEESWKNQMEKAKNQFEGILKMEEAGKKRNIILPLYWKLSCETDYALANDKLARLLRNPTDSKWWLYFNTQRPICKHEMDLDRKGYLQNADYWLAKAAALICAKDDADSHRDTAPSDGTTSRSKSEQGTSSNGHTSGSDDEKKPLVSKTSHADPYRVENNQYPNMGTCQTENTDSGLQHRKGFISTNEK